jgi:tetratricopeptide (TPR) repeat protein
MPESIPSETPKGAVFLSYASQDSEAAKRICEALRAAGVEVWFDQSELRGGDAWDQSIRKQIKECALFVPIISANTQARAEGYFRLEWRLADQRTHLMGRAKAFLLPVCVDGTRDADADIPDSFAAVQWTRLPGGEAPAAFTERVKKLLRGERTEESKDPHEKQFTAATAAKKLTPIWVAPLIIGVIAFLAWENWPWRKNEKRLATVPAAASVPEARQLVAKAWEQMSKTGFGPEELEFAEGYCKRAVELDPTDADAWAAWSQVNTWYVFYGFDDTPARHEAARSDAARALKLAPDSYEARLAQACYFVFCLTGGSGIDQASPFAPEADRLLRRLRQEEPNEPRALEAFGILQRNLRNFKEARDAFNRLAQNPKYAAEGWLDLADTEGAAGSVWAVGEPLKRSIAAQPFWGNLVLKVGLDYAWYGDLDDAKATLEQIPASVQADYGLGTACLTYYFRREPDKILKLLRGVPRDWLHSPGFDGPTAFWIAEAEKQAGRNDAARIEWESALALVEHRLTDQPASADLLHWKAKILRSLGKYDEAEKGFRQAAELTGERPDLLILKIDEGQMDAAMDILEHETNAWVNAAVLRLDPYLDPLRDNPRFKALLARSEADPERSPNAPKAPASNPAPTAKQN